MTTYPIPVDGRILAGGRPLGSGFWVTPDTVVTAAHVVRGRSIEDLLFVTGGLVARVTRIRVDEGWDVAALVVDARLPDPPPVGNAAGGGRWRVDARPGSSDPALTGRIDAAGRVVKLAGGREARMLQLGVDQNVRWFQGYSGAAVTTDDALRAVIGVVVEQVPERGPSGSMQRPAANILYAVPIADALTRLELVPTNPVMYEPIPASWPWPYPQQLPPRPYGFVGRAGVLAWLDDLAARRPAGPSLVCLDGMAGVGKSATAAYWAHRSATQFPDGRLYLDLRGRLPETVSLTETEALSHLLMQLGVPLEDIPASAREQGRTYRALTARRQLLILLDNPTDEAQVRPLLPSDPGCLTLVLSRQSLLGLVADPGALRATLDVLTEAESVKLFGELLGDLRIRPRTAAAEVARLCAYLPLALRIVAALLAGDEHLTLAEMAQRLAADNRLHRLRVPGDPAMAVTAAFDVSYARLAPPIRQMFRLLGAVPGPDFTPEVAAALRTEDGDHAAEELHLLARAHLLERPAPGRYRFHDLLRQYASERFEAEDAAATRHAVYERLFDHYLGTTDAAVRRMVPHVTRLPYPADQRRTARFDGPTSAGTWLDDEVANLVAAGRSAATHGAGQVAWLLSDRLRIYFWLRRRTAEWFSNARTGVAAAIAAGDAEGEAAARLSLGQAHSTVSDYDAAIGELERALSASRTAEWTDGAAASLGLLGTVCREAGRLADAADYYGQARDLFHGAENPAGEGAALANLGAVNWERGSLAQSASNSRQALELFERLGNRDGVCTILNNLAMVDLDSGSLDTAEEHARRAIEVADDLASVVGRAQGMDTLALVQRDLGRLVEARRSATDARRLAQEIGDRRIEVSAANTLGTISRLDGDPEAAGRHHRDALALAGNIGHLRGRADALLGLALLNLSAGNHEEGLSEATIARDIARTSMFVLVHGRALVLEGHLQRQLGAGAVALRRGVTALCLLADTGARPGQLDAIVLLHQLALDSDLSPSTWQPAVAALASLTTVPEAVQLQEMLTRMLGMDR